MTILRATRDLTRDLATIAAQTILTPLLCSLTRHAPASRRDPVGCARRRFSMGWSSKAAGSITSASWSTPKKVLASDWLAERDQAHRLIGAATANTDAIAAHAELVERVEALADECAERGAASRRVIAELRALIDPEATS